MKLSSITIKNFRSIKDLTFKVEEVDGSYTFALIGVNESGKSNFLEAIALAGDKEATISPKDYMDNNEEVLITLKYELGKEQAKNFHKKITEESDLNCTQDDISEVAVVRSFFPMGEDECENVGYTLMQLLPLQEKDEKLKFDTGIESFLERYFQIEDFRVILWKPDIEHLIADEIDLKEFGDDVRMSVPLLNCFRLADLEPRRALVSDPIKESDIAGELGDKITNHVKAIWPDHPVKIKFQISGGKLFFLIEDDQVKYRSKTIDQRSDGFRYFMSFILTTSIDSVRKLFPQSLFLIDEPETHLHPQAQMDLLKELIRITKGEKGETVLFFATHSVHMVDKKNVERCYKFSKQNGITKVEGTDTGILKSYAEISYDVFGVADHGYHNELYGYLKSDDVGKVKLRELPQDRKWFNTQTKRIEQVSLSLYIRNSIHHPENKENDPFTDEELRESIETMRKLVQEMENEERTEVEGKSA